MSKEKMSSNLKCLREVWDRNTWSERIKWILNCLLWVPVLLVIIVWYDKVLTFLQKARKT